MCGIVGIVKASMGQQDRLDVERMCALIRRRGPDDDGFFFGEQVGLGMRRLAIIDVAAGHQPIANEDQSVWIVFNGEIYNYQQLQQDLQSRGHTLKTNSDTECIVHLYEEYGDDCVSHLRGMFAFAIWDKRKKKLLLARDRLGIKPLFYWKSKDQLAFASEPKSILSLPGFNRDVDLRGLSGYFTYGYVPSPDCIFQGIQQLPPGHVCIWSAGAIKIRRYWKVQPVPDREKPLSWFAERLLAELEEAVKLHMLSEVPLGAFLSGGIDSGAIVAMMSRGVTCGIKTFTVGFRASEPKFDERPFARIVATKFGTSHEECLLDQQVDGILPEMVRAFDEPFADSSMIPNYLIYQAARKIVTVALSGLGGDELFAGYERYRGAIMAEYYRVVPRFLRQGVAGVVKGMRESKNAGPWVNRLKRFVGSADLTLRGRYQQYIAVNDSDEKRGLFSEDLAGHLQGQDWFEAASAINPSDEGMDPLDQMLCADMQTYLPDDLLRMTDRLSMWHSLEVRVPFLDHKLVEFANTIPAEFKLKLWKKKYVLTESLKGILPKEILSRRKQGFSIPLNGWLRGPLKDFVNDSLAESVLRKVGFFNTQTVKKILHEHQSGLWNHEVKIWALLVFVQWHRQYIENLPEEPGTTGL